MKLGIMQPYFLPYIGYWQLLNEVDKYVIYDDVNFIKGGWINRNRILVNNKITYFNLPMIGASSSKLINQIRVNNDFKIMHKKLKTIELAYKKSPYFNEVYPIIKEILLYDDDNIALFIKNSMKIICEYLNIKTDIILSSDLKKDNTLRGQDKVLAICKILNASEYYNAIGGMELYSFDDFNKEGIQLKFLKSSLIKYKQFETSVENLSILDMLMFNSQEQVKAYLKEFEVIER